MMKTLTKYFDNTIGTDQEVDLTSSYNILEFIYNKKIEYIINCAAYTNVEKAEVEKEMAFNINALAVGKLAMAANFTKCPLIHFSTDFVFDGTNNNEYYETDHTLPVNYYGDTKLKGEQLALTIANKLFIFRISWLIGNYRPNFASIINNLLLTKPQVDVVNDEFGSPTNAKDVAYLIKFLIDNKIDKYGIYHFSAEDKISRYDMAVNIMDNAIKHSHKNVGKVIPISSKELSSSTHRPANSYLNKNKIKKELGITVKSSNQVITEFLYPL